MPDRIIDGDRWIAERLKFLRECLAGELSDSERQAVESEIEALSGQRRTRRNLAGLPIPFPRRRRK